MTRAATPIACCFSIASSLTACVHAPAQPVAPVTRTALLTAPLEGRPGVERVEVRRIELAPGLASGTHLHPCPVVGFVTAGTVYFQLEGEAPRVLGAGEAFFEPANARVLNFDAQAEGATFVAHYLVASPDQELIRMLP